MPRITFILPGGEHKTVNAPENWSLQQAAIENAIPGVGDLCGGVMACATCHVHIHPDWTERTNARDNEKTEEETDTLDMAQNVTPHSRLSCQVRITQALDGLVVIVPPQN